MGLVSSRVLALSLLVFGVTSPLPAQNAGKRALTVDDLFRLREVDDPQLSPDGQWVAYTVRTLDPKSDSRDTDIWMASWDGTQNLRLTWSKASETTPRWSPDGRSLAFLSGREDEHESDQIWLLNRAGGEAEKLTTFAGGVSDYAWSPDGTRLALIVDDPDSSADSAKSKTPPPIVIDRFQFKEDITGYLTTKRSHLYVFDLASRKAELLTPGDFYELLPAWSPNGKSIAFVSKRRPEFDRTDNWDLYAVEAAPGAMPRQLTTFEGADNDPTFESRPAWSPDGKSIAYLQGGPQKLIYYAVQKLAVVPATGGPPRVLTGPLDRWVLSPQWSADGYSILFLLEDDRTFQLVRMPAAGGALQRLTPGRRTVIAFSQAAGKIAILESRPQEPPEIWALDGGDRRGLSRQNDSLLAGVRLGDVTEIEVKSRDGTPIGAFVVTPPDYQPGKRYPAILRIHGGPVSQFQNEFDFSWQLLAANGFVVVAANPRGSSGRGEKFATAIYADWGNKDVQDVLAAVDYVTTQGLADPARLGVGGWSYGGILTNYVIASDARFKAAVSGASISNILAGYGTDQYVREYETELGLPWKNVQAWLRLSYPFLHADRIVTPTLFICGEADFNVPLLNSEQMYQALRSLGRETQLVIYPGQFHGITKPSYQKDRLERYLSWYGKYLSPHPLSPSP